MSSELQPEKLGGGSAASKVPIGEPLLKVRDLKKYFPIRKGLFSRHVADVRAVDGVSFDIYPRETLGIVGESGCGKTTLGRTILRLLEPTAGSATFDGQEVFELRRPELRAIRRDMQIIFQDPYSSLNPRMTVGNIIGDALELHGLAKGDERFDHAKMLLERVGLQASYINRYPHEFSGGQRQRIGIARAVALRPKFIVCDEAVSALDVSVQAQILNLLMDLQRDFELSYMFIAHDLSVVRHISDRVAVMYLGRIVEISPCDDLYENPMHPYTQALLSAIPYPDPTRKIERVILKGDVPTPINPPSGCHFHTRCPMVFDRCSVVEPVSRELRPGHQVACHLYDDSLFPAEPIRIGERRVTANGGSEVVGSDTRAPSVGSSTDGDDAVGVQTVPHLEDSLGFGGFDAGTEDLDSPQRQHLPGVLRDREGMTLGPFGEVIDPEETTDAEAPALDSFVNMQAELDAADGAPDLDDEATIVDSPTSRQDPSGLQREPTGVIPPIQEGSDEPSEPGED
jgi:oligopeptide/dipeptide ABC transporter ATP-binding protein